MDLLEVVEVETERLYLTIFKYNLKFHALFKLTFKQEKSHMAWS